MFVSLIIFILSISFKSNGIATLKHKGVFILGSCKKHIIMTTLRVYVIRSRYFKSSHFADLSAKLNVFMTIVTEALCNYNHFFRNFTFLCFRKHSTCPINIMKKGSFCFFFVAKIHSTRVW
ncbi:ORF6 [Turkey adenovirus 3]|uniref:Uncharacterized protein n=1 Tax=Turkey adenovirus 3 TaxID=41678 RepID=Q9YUQ8_9ADEN|nr:hypothetical protein [Turkey adenovirus 3]AAC64544.1 ORF6 [Turkey adenovirus 3]